MSGGTFDDRRLEPQHPSRPSLEDRDPALGERHDSRPSGRTNRGRRWPRRRLYKWPPRTMTTSPEGSLFVGAQAPLRASRGARPPWAAAGHEPAVWRLSLSGAGTTMSVSGLFSFARTSTTTTVMLSLPPLRLARVTSSLAASLGWGSGTGRRRSGRPKPPAASRRCTAGTGPRALG